MTPSVFRPIQFATFGFLTLVVVALLGSAWLSYLESEQLEEAEEVLGRLDRFERTHLVVTQELVELQEGPIPDAQATALVQQIEDLVSLSLSPDTREKLHAMQRSVRHPAEWRRTATSQSLVVFREIGVRERANHADALGALRRDAVTQLKLDTAIPIALLAGGVLLIPLARRRIIQPLHAFGRQLTRLAQGDWSPAPVAHIDPLMLPLHRTFNELVQRLHKLETEHANREHHLEEEVRAATRALLEQQRNLARAERLAATGELAASVAHELRNPLAGIRMTLTNLRAELHEGELVERVDLVIAEVDRLTRLLNQLLDAARHEPEPSRPIELRDLIDDILSLLRYQLPANVRLEQEVEPALVCRLPPDRLRGALLNLILNAAALLPSGGVIQVGAVRAGERIRLSVCDDGPGFPAELLDGGVRPFFSTRERGTGLGLAMVRRFVRDVGGEVVLSNREPHGACVTLMLPSDADHG